MLSDRSIGVGGPPRSVGGTGVSIKSASVWVGGATVFVGGTGVLAGVGGAVVAVGVGDPSAVVGIGPVEAGVRLGVVEDSPGTRVTRPPPDKAGDSVRVRKPSVVAYGEGVAPRVGASAEAAPSPPVSAANPAGWNPKATTVV